MQTHETLAAPPSGIVVWITGLPSAGKSRLATEIACRARESGKVVCVLDGDAVRAAIVPLPGYDEVARDAFYPTLGRLAALVATQGLVVIVPATAHRRAYRDEARRAAPRFIEVFVDADPQACRSRDTKGLYARGVAGLPGIDVAYEPPETPEVIASGGQDRAAVQRVLDLLFSEGKEPEREVDP